MVNMVLSRLASLRSRRGSVPHSVPMVRLDQQRLRPWQPAKWQVQAGQQKCNATSPIWKPLEPMNVEETNLHN